MAAADEKAKSAHKIVARYLIARMIHEDRSVLLRDLDLYGRHGDAIAARVDRIRQITDPGKDAFDAATEYLTGGGS